MMEKILDIYCQKKMKLGILFYLKCQLDIKEIIVGMPYNQDGKKNDKCLEIEAFIDNLKGNVSIPVISYDERYSTVAASRQLQELGYNQKKQRGKIDSVAAAFILQGYLDRK